MQLLRQALALVAPPFCWACGGEARHGEPLCHACHAKLPWLGPGPVAVGGVEVWAPLAYEGPAKALVRALKFRGAAGLAHKMAAQIVAGAPEGLLPADATLVPVPLHPSRARRRGFNQAERIAVAIGSRTGLPVGDCLRRRGPGRARQVGRGRVERLGAVADAIEAEPATALPARAVIVDDVVTTGATLAACASALRRRGVSAVWAVAYARTPPR